MTTPPPPVEVTWPLYVVVRARKASKVLVDLGAMEVEPESTEVKEANVSEVSKASEVLASSEWVG
jgi:hypothetical protein